jgi:hypothetical protein
MATAFSLLTDGSQARKTKSEKELIFLRTIKDGNPVFFCVALENIDDYGDATSDNLKKSVENALIEKLKMTKEAMVHKMVSAVADEASVNMGHKTGMLTQLKEERKWLLSIHCICHRVELAFRDSLMGFKELTDVKDFMVSITFSKRVENSQDKLTKQRKHLLSTHIASQRFMGPVS